MKRRWNATQKSKLLEHKAHMRPQDTEWRAYEMRAFSHNEVAAELVRRHRHVAPGHPENPKTRFFAQQAEGLTREVKARNPSPPLERGDNGAAME